ncbi:hypothetical protein K4K49_006779 [Colletotrichum sp. SAR 10_70]|nr:hypothetical protein K4K50_003819 [Colletotrichum sp. SAR 10_71]KAI8196358.1 hypothetical protein K4K49_006779 [Colletotrichum sp. SAR 10_70]
MVRISGECGYVPWLRTIRHDLAMVILSSGLCKWKGVDLLIVASLALWLWDIITKILRAKVPDEKWEHTSEKMKNFKKAAGTVLFFEDQQIVEDLQKKYPSYATEVPLWAAQSDGMLQYAVWTLLAAEDIGANLQHYNPIIDEEVAKAWNVSPKWKLKGQLVFGGITGEPKPKDYMPMADRFRSYA